MSTSSAIANAKRGATKKDHGKPARQQPRVSLAERLSWALTRVRSARFRANMDPSDPVYRAALVARCAEYADLRAIIQRGI